jgi:hypothetical protein
MLVKLGVFSIAGELRGNRHPNRHLQSAWNKYGAQAFKFEVLEIVPKDRLTAREQYWLDLHRVDLGLKVYNMRPPQDSWVGPPKSEEVRQKHRRPRSLESRLKQSETIKANPQPRRKGFKRSESSIAKQAATRAAKVYPKQSHSDESGHKMSELKKGKPASSAAIEGAKQSPEWVAKRIDQLRGRERPLEVIEQGRIKRLDSFIERFLARAQEIYGSKYDYSSTNVQGNRTLTQVICSRHGAFEVSPYLHLRGKGCPSCL